MCVYRANKKEAREEKRGKEKEREREEGYYASAFFSVVNLIFDWIEGNSTMEQSLQSSVREAIFLALTGSQLFIELSRRIRFLSVDVICPY